MRVIQLPLPNGAVALVDEDDWPRVSKLRWSDKGGGYVHAVFKKRAGGDQRIVSLHRFILGAPAGLVVDHIDGNPLNNTRGNLQIITQARNQMRSRAARAGGIQRHGAKWRVRVSVDGKQKSFGFYGSLPEAEAALERVRREIWPVGGAVF